MANRSSVGVELWGPLLLHTGIFIWVDLQSLEGFASFSILLNHFIPLLFHPFLSLLNSNVYSSLIFFSRQFNVLACLRNILWSWYEIFYFVIFAEF